MTINAILKSSTTTKTQDDGSPGIVTLRNYQHASRIFVDGNYRLSPKYNYLFYVEFDFNPNITNLSTTTARELGMIVKNVGLPKFTVQVKEHNAYNRKNYVQNSIKYDPVSIKFHDDQADNVRNFWYDYYSYYYRDPDYADATYQALHKYQSRPSFDWGYSPRASAGYNSSRIAQPYQYIQAIRIYSLYQKNFSQYELINPIITSFKHGDHANGEAGTMEHEMSIQYEAVKYYTGYTTADTVGGYIDLHYDNTPSPIAPAGGTGLIDNGRGGYTTANDNLIDLANPATTSTALDAGLRSTQNNSSTSTSSAFNSTTLGASSSGSNNGGMTLPVFGSSNGIPNGAQLGNQLAGTATNAVGGATYSAANGVVGSVTGGAAGATIGALGAVIKNPGSALKTAENMALAYGEGIALNYVNSNIISPLVNTATGIVNNTLNVYVTTPLTNAFNSASSAVSGAFNSSVVAPTVNAQNGYGFVTNEQLAANPDLVAQSDAAAYGAVSTPYAGTFATDAFNNSDNFG